MNPEEIIKKSHDFFGQMTEAQLREMIRQLEADLQKDVGGEAQAERDMIKMLKDILHSKTTDQ